MKKISIGIVLAIMVVFFNFHEGIGHAATFQFKDITSSSSTYGYAYSDVSYLIQKGVINDYKISGSYYFKPGSPVTKAQAAITLVKALGDKPSTVKTPYFKDVTASDSAFGYIQKAKELGIFTGNSNGIFGPNTTLTKSQAASAIVKTFKLSVPKSVPNGFSDVTSGKSNYSNINALYFDGITQGNSGKYLPNNTINRADFSVFVARGMVTSKRVNPKIGTKSVITVSYLNVRNSPSLSGHSEGILSKGTKVDIYTGGTSIWYKINYKGKWGYVSKKYIGTPSSSSQSSSTPTSTATQTSPNCSPSGTYIASTSSACSSTTTTPTSFEGGSTKPLANKIIVIDPGHGGSDPGTSSNGIDEKTVTLAVGLDVRSKLEALGATVYMTRTTDTFPTLAERVALSNKYKPNLFLSIHCNSASPSAFGTETYYDTAFNPFPTQSQGLGNDIQQGIVKTIGSYDRGSRSDTTLYDTGLYVLSNNNYPAVLTELGFLTNTSERAMLTSPTDQQLYATGITNGILAYFSLQS